MRLTVVWWPSVRPFCTASRTIGLFVMPECPPAASLRGDHFRWEDAGRRHAAESD